MKLVIDCNLWISFLLGFQNKLMTDLLQSEMTEIYVCNQLLDEIDDVASRDKIKQRVSEEDIEKLFRLIKAYCIRIPIQKIANSNIRDKKDLYLLSLAETIEADYIISGDFDLLVLQQHRTAQIVSPTHFREIFYRNN